MNLYITDVQTDPMAGVRVLPDLLTNKQAHLVIASSMWDEAWIEVAESIEEGCLIRLSEKCRKVYVQVPEHPSRHQMVLLCELFPALSGTIRKTFLKGESIHGVLPYLWKQGDTPGRGALQVQGTD